MSQLQGTRKKLPVKQQKSTLNYKITLQLYTWTSVAIVPTRCLALRPNLVSPRVSQQPSIIDREAR